MSEWISIKDMIPSEGRYLFATKTNGVCSGFLSAYAAKYNSPESLIGSKGFQFTHWMPLPEPPKEETNK